MVHTWDILVIILIINVLAVMPPLLLFEHVIGSQVCNFVILFIPQNQIGFVKGTSAQDCGVTIGFIAT